MRGKKLCKFMRGPWDGLKLEIEDPTEFFTVDSTTWELIFEGKYPFQNTYRYKKIVKSSGLILYILEEVSRIPTD